MATQLFLNPMEVDTHEVVRVKIRVRDQGLHRVSIVSGLGWTRCPKVVVEEK
jgi:hypothetical protein